MMIFLGIVVALLAQGAPSQPTAQTNQPVVATASIEGMVVRIGTSEPLAGADVELTRMEGTPAAPMTPQAMQYVS
ncbi:MAG TPA: hypothetical protein VFR18_11040, partial [Terriglobia bacterium]|nr:hypothetical protein [Terriglobia bacterium]